MLRVPGLMMNKQWQQWRMQLQAVDTPVLRWAGAAIVLLVLWGVLLMPYLDWRAQRLDVLQGNMQKLERLQALQSASAQWKKAELEWAERAATFGSLFFAGSSYAVSQTDLLKVLHADISRFHLVLESQRLLDAEVVQGVGEQVGVNLRCHGALSDVLRFVDALAGDSHLLMLHSLYISQLQDNQALLQIGVHGYRPVQTMEHSP